WPACLPSGHWMPTAGAVGTATTRQTGFPADKPPVAAECSEQITRICDGRQPPQARLHNRHIGRYVVRTAKAIEDHPLVALTDTPRRFTALGVIRVRYGETVALRRLHCPVSAPIAAARLPGRTGQLVPAFACTWPIGPQALDHRDGQRDHP